MIELVNAKMAKKKKVLKKVKKKSEQYVMTQKISCPVNNSTVTVKTMGNNIVIVDSHGNSLRMSVTVFKKMQKIKI